MLLKQTSPAWRHSRPLFFVGESTLAGEILPIHSVEELGRPSERHTALPESILTLERIAQ